jgi:hypothetical protein
MPMRARGSAFLLVVAAAARAANPTPAPADPIAAAKSDIAAMRAPAAPTDLGVNVPVLEMKDVGTVPGAALPFLAAPATDDELGPDGLKKKKDGTGNWLVDAMDKKSDHAVLSRSDERDAAVKADLELLRGEGGIGSHDAKDGLNALEPREKLDSSDVASHPYNPLDSFMGGWISAKDHDLLLPGAHADSADPSKTRSDALQSLELGPSESTLPAPDPSAFADSKQTVNPYLAELDALPLAQVKAFTAPEIPAFAPLEPSDTQRGSQGAGVDSRPGDSTHPFVPDFAQPSDDDKYFKQLKRF